MSYTHTALYDGQDVPSLLRLLRLLCPFHEAWSVRGEVDANPRPKNDECRALEVYVAAYIQ